MAGTGVNRRCSGGKVIEGCDRYESDSDGKIYCSSCNSAKNYQFVLDLNDSTANKCVLCDRSTNYMKGDVCTPATKVKDCARYELHKDACKSCKGDLDIAGNVNLCVELGKNCASMSNKIEICATCLSGFHMAADKKSCHPNIPNCAIAIDGNDKYCKKCDYGYALKSDQTCEKINVANCDEGSNANFCTSCSNGYFLKNSSTCVKLGVANCANSDKTKLETKCDVCKKGYVLKEDQTACGELKSCMPFQSTFKTNIRCFKCNVPDNYYATDVKGGEEIKFQGEMKWEQVCTKAAKIFAIAFVALSTVAYF